MSKIQKIENGPLLVNTDRTVFVDCDQTLIDWSGSSEGDVVTLLNGECQTYTIRRMAANIGSLMLHKQLGHFIVVWSAAGFDHAKSVVEALGLMNYVDLIMAKPDIFIDDLPASEWLNESKRRWKE